LRVSLLRTWSNDFNKILQKLLSTLQIQGSGLQLLFVCGIGITIGFVVVTITTLPPQWMILVIVACLFIFITIIIGNVRKIFLALIIFDIPFQLDTHLGYREEVEALGALAGWNLSITTIALIVLYSLWIFDILLKQSEAKKFCFTRLSIPLTVYMIFCFLSTFVAQDIQLSLFKNFLLLQQFLLFIYIVGTVRSRDDIYFIFIILLFALVLESSIIICLRGIGHTIKIAGLTARINENGRVGGTLGGPNSAGAYLSLMLAPALSLIITKTKKSHKWLGILAFSIGIIALILTLSRGAWLAFVISIFLFIAVGWYKGWLSFKVPVILLILSAILLFIGKDIFLERLFGDDAGSAYSRFPLMELAFRIIKDNLLLGVGINNFSIVMPDYISSKLAGLWLHAVHHKYLLVWAEIGTGGLLAFIWFLLTSIRCGWKSRIYEDPVFSPIGLAIAFAIIGHTIQMNFDTFQNRELIQALWLNSALVVSIYNTMSLS